KNKKYLRLPEEEQGKSKRREKNFFTKLIVILKKKENVKLEYWKSLFLEEMLVDAVSGIDLIEIYDEYREDNFTITAVIQSQEKEEQPTTFISEEVITYPTELLDPTINFLEFTKIFAEKNSSFTKKPISIFPEEAFYLDKITQIPRLIEFVFDGSILIGLLADKYVKKSQLSSKREEIYKRRTIIRKARELLSVINARKVTTVEDAGKRILPYDISWDKITVSYEDKLLFYQEE
ncbi:MAG: hypothetical protein ACTSPI_12380, partial [Candidatus Heimdallarchaeaceae archaeon]